MGRLSKIKRYATGATTNKMYCWWLAQAKKKNAAEIPKKDFVRSIKTVRKKQLRSRDKIDRNHLSTLEMQTRGSLDQNRAVSTKELTN